MFGGCGVIGGGNGGEVLNKSSISWRGVEATLPLDPDWATVGTATALVVVL